MATYITSTTMGNLHQGGERPHNTAESRWHSGRSGKYWAYPGLPGRTQRTTDYRGDSFRFGINEKSHNPHIRGSVGFLDKPVEYDEQKAHKLWSILHNYDWDIVPDHDCVHKALLRLNWLELEPNLFYTLDCLEIFESSGKKAPKAWSARRILRACLVHGPDFYDLYKDERREAYRKGILAFAPDSLEPFIQDGEDPRDYWRGPDSWFDMRFSVFWKLVSEDIEYSFFEGVGYIDDSVLNELVLTVSNMFEGQTVDELPLSGLYETSSSKSVDLHNLEKTVPEWLLTYNNPEYDESVMDFFVKEVQIPKQPGETRDGAVVSPSTKKALKSINMAMMLLLKHNQYAKRRTPMCMNKEEFDHELDRMSRFYYWYCRDYEKIGLTLPFQVISGVLQGLYNATGYEPFWEGKKFFSNPRILTLDGKIKSTIRGFFLGMFNEGMTIVQLALDRMVSSQMETKPRALVLNDDSVFGFRHYETLQEYVESDRTISISLNIPWKEAKCFGSSEGFVFCEEYYLFDEEEEKTLLPLYALQKAYYMPTIRRAKQLVNAIAGAWNIKPAYLKNVMAFWGYEFYEEETTKPFELGGWLPFYTDGFNLALRLCEWTTQECAALMAVNSYVKPKGKVGITPTTTLGRVIRAFNNEGKSHLEDDEKFDLVDLFGDLTAIASKRMSSITGKDRSQYFFLQEQGTVLRNYRKWMDVNVLPLNTEEKFVKKGFLPSDYELSKRGVVLNNFITYTSDAMLSEGKRANLRLAYILRKNGVSVNHPLLSYTQVEAEALLMADFASREHFGFFQKDLTMPEYDPVYYSIIKYCVENFGQAPIYGETNYRYFFSMIFDGVVPKDDHIKFLMEVRERDYPNDLEFIHWLISIGIEADELVQRWQREQEPIEVPEPCEEYEGDLRPTHRMVPVITPDDRNNVRFDSSGLVIGERSLLRVPINIDAVQLRMFMRNYGVFPAVPEEESSSESDDFTGGLVFGDEDADY